MAGFSLPWLVWIGLVWFGLVWIGLVWFGLVWYGLVWFGLVEVVGVVWVVGVVGMVWGVEDVLVIKPVFFKIYGFAEIGCLVTFCLV